MLKTKFIGKKRSETIQKLASKGSIENDVIQYTKNNFPLFISSNIVTITIVAGVIKGHIQSTGI